MSVDADEDLFAEFAEDYFAECDEHLTVIRRDLLTVEAFVNQPEIDRSLVEELFRSFHSLKGMSGMIGVKEAEQLAHDMESYLRVLQKKQVILSQAGLDALIVGTKMLDQVIAMRRSQNPAPDIAPAICQIQAVLPDSARPIVTETVAAISERLTSALLTLKPEESTRLTAAVNGGKKTWQVEFVPIPGLAERNINVSEIRDRLQANGEIIHAEPRITSTGGIIFNFVVASNADESIFASWKNDGVTYIPYVDREEVKQSSTEVEQDHLDTENYHQNQLVLTPILEEQPTSHPSPITHHPISTSVVSNVVRVDLARLDELMQIVGELVISKAHLEDNLTNLKKVVPMPQLRALQETSLTLERQLRDLREGIMRVRLVPISEIFARMQFVVRDITREIQQKVTLELSGQETEIDKFIIERMMDPLLHLVRNAVSHGLESESDRVRLGKLPVGKLALRAATVGEFMVIEVEDDGRGVDLEHITARAYDLGLVGADAKIDTATALDIICSPGFSTRDQVDLTSGRGVGMAVVKNTVQELGGLITLESKVGEGTRFSIQLPLTLAIANALIVFAGEQTFAAPLCSVREVFELQSTAITVLENNEILAYRGGVLPLIRLSRQFRLGESSGDRQFVFVVGQGQTAAGIVVDRILGQREIVVRAIADPLVQVVGISGATELGDGRVVLIIDAIALSRVSRSY